MKPNDMEDDRLVYFVFFSEFYDRIKFKWVALHFEKKIRFLERVCHCDKECQSYGDCCYDASSADVRYIINNNITDVKFSRNSLACLPLRFKDNDYNLDQRVTLH
jgi:hypothetical protein